MNLIGWVEIYVDDMNRAKAFYENVFGVKLTQIPDTPVELWAFPMQQGQPGAAGALVRMPGIPAGKNSVLVYFHTEDCAVQAAKAAKSGGRVEKDKFSIGQHGFIAHVVDTEGNMIGLHSMK